MSTPAYAYGCQTPPNPPQVQYTQPCPDCAALREHLAAAEAREAKLRDALTRMLAAIADHLGDLEIYDVLRQMGVPEPEPGDEHTLNAVAVALRERGFTLPSWCDPDEMEAIDDWPDD